jgi:hypothetical protein
MMSGRQRRAHGPRGLCQVALSDPDLEALALELELTELVLPHHVQDSVYLVKVHRVFVGADQLP